GGHHIKGLHQCAHLRGGLQIKSGVKLTLADPEQSASQLLQGPAHASGMKVSTQDRHHDSPKAQPAHRGSSCHRLVTRCHGFTGGHPLAEVYECIDPSGDLVTEPGLVLLPGTLRAESRGQTCREAGMRLPYLGQEIMLMCCVHEGGDFLKEAGE